MSFSKFLKPQVTESVVEKYDPPSRDGSFSPQSSEEQPEAGLMRLEESQTGGLGRHLGLFSTTFLIINRIIGTGIFSTPSSITKSVGSVGAAMMLWTLGFFLSFAGMLIWLELGCMIPRSGGEKVYLEASYKHPRMLATVFFAFQAILLGFTASGCTVFASNIVLAANRKVGEWEERGIAIAALTFITMIHVCFPKWGVRGMNVIGLIKLGTLLFVVVTGWVVLGGGFKSVPDPRASFRNSFAGSSTSSNQYATALFKVLSSFAGWSNASYVLNEVKNPVRTLKIAGPLGLTICGILYMFANIAYFAAATPEEVQASGVTVASHYMGKLFGQKGQQALSALVALSAFGNVMTVTFAQARVNQELAKEGAIPFPKFWASNWPFGSPSAGLFLHYIPSFIVLIAIPFGDAYSFILDVEGYPGSIMFLLVIVGFFLLRFKLPEKHAHRPFKVWWGVAVFFLAGQLFQIFAPFLRPPGGKGDTSLPYWLAPVVGLIVLGGGLTYWAVWWLVLPRVMGHTLVPEKEKLADGTTVVVYKRVKKD